jgi:hypothetical protein
MANRTKAEINFQNLYGASTTVSDVRHFHPKFDSTIEAPHSLVAQFTGTGSNNVTCGVGGAITVNGVTQKSPITAINLDWDNHFGFAVIPERAVAATPPTGVPTLNCSGFGGMTLSATIPLSEGFGFAIKHGTAVNAASTEALTVNLTGTTGWKVSVIAFGSSD